MCSDEKTARTDIDRFKTTYQAHYSDPGERDKNITGKYYANYARLSILRIVVFFFFFLLDRVYIFFSSCAYDTTWPRTCDYTYGRSANAMSYANKNNDRNWLPAALSSLFFEGKCKLKAWLQAEECIAAREEMRDWQQTTDAITILEDRIPRQH